MSRTLRRTGLLRGEVVLAFPSAGMVSQVAGLVCGSLFCEVLSGSAPPLVRCLGQPINVLTTLFPDIKKADCSPPVPLNTLAPYLPGVGDHRSGACPSKLTEAIVVY